MQVHQFPHSDHRKPCSVYDVYLACKLFRRWAPITCERRLSFSSESRVSLRMGFSIPQSFELYSVSSRSRFMSRTSHGPLSHYMLLGTLEPTSPMGSKRERFAMTSRHGPLVCHQCARLVVDVLHGSQITPRLKSDNSCARPNAFLLAHGCPQRIADAIRRQRATMRTIPCVTSSPLDPFMVRCTWKSFCFVPCTHILAMRFVMHRNTRRSVHLGRFARGRSHVARVM